MDYINDEDVRQRRDSRKPSWKRRALKRDDVHSWGTDMGKRKGTKAKERVGTELKNPEPDG